MGYIFEISGGRGGSVSDIATAKRKFLAVGYADESSVATAFSTYVVDQGINTIGGVTAADFDMQELEGFDGIWDITCSWETFRPKEPTPASTSYAAAVPEFAFSFALSSEKIVKPIGSQSVYKRTSDPGTTPSIQLIGDQGDGKPPAGVDLLVPEISFSEKRYLRWSYWTETTRNTFLRMIGKVSSTPFRSFDPGEVLCAGISGAGRGRDDIELQFSYRVRENKTISVSGFDDFDKLGWQYLWPRHYLKVQGTEKIVTQEIQYLCLADVYEEASFSVLE
jgi:hypothetical protein